MASKLLSCSLACSTQVVLEHETRCLNVKLLIFSGLARAIQKLLGNTMWEEQMYSRRRRRWKRRRRRKIEEETREPIKWRTARDSPEQGITFSFAGVGGKCCSMELLTPNIWTKDIRPGSAELNLAIDSASDGGRIRRRVPRA
jgi:hypothetical protein